MTANSRIERKRATMDRIMAKFIIAACFIIIGFGIGVIATLKVVGFTW